MLQFCKNRLKIEQKNKTLSLMLVQNYMQNSNFSILQGKLTQIAKKLTLLFFQHNSYLNESLEIAM